MFDDDELAALDEWRFAMRMPSRAAAMRALMRFGLRLDVEVEDMEIDPAMIASNKIGVVGGVDIDPNKDEAERLSQALGGETLKLVRELAEQRGLGLNEAIHEACAQTLSADPATLRKAPEARSNRK
tara:strand:- start:177 stop:557 length:381 start_codon:yes stop_codon:yes gene_type:complete